MIAREAALERVTKEIVAPNLIKHSIATEAVMRGLAVRLGEDESLWGLTGLLHDLDYAQTFDKPELHARLSVKMLAGDLPEESLHAILAHCGQIEAESVMDWAIRCSDPVTGLVTAAVFMHPARNLAALDVGFLAKRYKEKRFAAGANREQIAECERIGVPLDEFLGIALTSMQAASTELGL